MLVAAAATAAAWFFLVREPGEDGSHEAATPARGVSKPVAGVVQAMTPAERVDQLMLLGFEGSDSSSAGSALRNRQLGGVLVSPSNWPNATEGRALLGDLRAAALEGGRISPLFVTTQEGGPYRALFDLPPEERELDIGRTGDPAAAEAWARATADALRPVGIDLNLSPVADVATIDSPLAGRAFSDDAALAAEMTAAAVRGCRAGRIGCAPLHFPGQGAASQDTGEGPATVSLDAASLADRDLAAFRAAFAEHAPAVVLSLAFYAAYDPVTPAALAPPVATDLLRDELGFEGAAITDDLSSAAIRAQLKVPAAAVAAIQAGADMVQISAPRDQDGVAHALLDAVDSGEISGDRLNEAAGRVLELKRELGLLRP